MKDVSKLCDKANKKLESGQVDEAIELFMKASDEGSLEASYLCAKAIMDNFNDEDHMSTAKNLLWDSDAGKATEDLLLQAYSEGRFEYDSDIEMFNIDKILASRGDAEAMYDAGRFCMDGIDGWESGEDPTPWFQQASAKGFRPADVMLALIEYMEGDALKSKAVFENNMWSDISLLCLGAMHWNGDADFKRSKKNATECWNAMTEIDENEVIGLIPDWNSNEKIDINDLYRNLDVPDQYPDERNCREGELNMSRNNWTEDELVIACAAYIARGDLSNGQLISRLETVLPERTKEAIDRKIGNIKSCDPDFIRNG